MKRATIIIFRKKNFLLISIHTLCEEGDNFRDVQSVGKLYFNPHPLWRGWPRHTDSVRRQGSISIHTLCEEGDLSAIDFWLLSAFISIHTLCEEGDFVLMTVSWVWGLFQSTPSVKRVTMCFWFFFWQWLYFNPHPLWRGWLWPNRL